MSIYDSLSPTVLQMAIADGDKRDGYRRHSNGRHTIHRPTTHGHTQPIAQSRVTQKGKASKSGNPREARTRPYPTKPRNYTNNQRRKQARPRRTQTAYIRTINHIPTSKMNAPTRSPPPQNVPKQRQGTTKAPRRQLQRPRTEPTTPELHVRR